MDDVIYLTGYFLLLHNCVSRSKQINLSTNMALALPNSYSVPCKKEKRIVVSGRQRDRFSVPEMTFRWMLVCLCVNRSESPKDRRAGWARYCMSSYVTEAALRGGKKMLFFPHCYNESRAGWSKGHGDDFKGRIHSTGCAYKSLPKFSALQSSWY